MSDIIKNSVEVIEVPKPKGRYIIELFDAETGELQDQRVVDNYITPAHNRQVLWAQGLLAAFTRGWLGSAARYRDHIGQNASIAGTQKWMHEVVYAGPPITDNSLVCTDWAAAEDTSVDWAKGNIIAYATKGKRTVSSSGRAGLINETSCILADDLETLTWVFDWNTTQGNGTFSSVMMTNVYNLNPDHEFIQFAHSNKGRWLGYPGLGVVSTPGKSLCVDPDNGDLYGIAFLAVNYGTPRILKWTDAQWDAMATVDGSGDWGYCGDATNQCALANIPWTTATTTTSAVNGGGGLGLCKLPTGGDFVTVAVYNNGTWHFSRQNTAGTSVVSNAATGATACATITSGNSRNVGCVYLGSKIYAACATFVSSGQISVQAENNLIKRFNPTTGAFEANIALPAGVYHYGAIFTDGTNLLISTNRGLIILDTAGAPVAPYNLGAPYPRWSGSSTPLDSSSGGNAASMHNGPTYAAVAPDSGGASLAGFWFHGTQGTRRPPFAFYETEGANSLTTKSSHMSMGTYQGETAVSNQISGADFGSASSDYGSQVPCYIWKDSKLWHIGIGFTGVVTVPGLTNIAGFPVGSCDGSNMFSRTLLGSPVTKTSTQTMKITYELNLPTKWWGAITPPNPLA